MANPKPKLRPLTLSAVALGGMIGAAARVYLPWPVLLDEPQAIFDPLPTVMVNLIGAVLLGLTTGYTQLRPWPEPVIKGITTGCLGSFTTMSALAVLYSGWATGQTLLTARPLTNGLASLALLTFGIVAVLWLTTLLTTWTYQLGRRLASDA